MRVVQRLMGVENPIKDLKVYEHTLHFRNGVAVVDTLTEREINRLRAFGFRVERDGTSKKTAPKTPEVAAPAADPEPVTQPEGVPAPQLEAPAEAPKVPAKPKRPAPKREA